MSEKGGPGYIELIVGESGDGIIRSTVLPCEWVGKVINWTRLSKESILMNCVVWSELVLGKDNVAVEAVMNIITNFTYKG